MKAIGGYNSLALKCSARSRIKFDYCYQSARASLYSFLNESEATSIYVPEYMCDSIYEAIESLNIKVVSYCLNEDMTIESFPTIGDTEYILVVNYYGLLDQYLEELLRLHCSERIIIDNSQALFYRPSRKVTAIYSPRKFLAVPDGGFLNTTLSIQEPSKKWQSLDNISHLVLRAFGLVGEGYKEFLRSEESLSDYIPQSMSCVTKRMIEFSDLKHIKEKRRENFKYLSRLYGDINEFSWSINSCVPLCYPLKLDFDIANIYKELCSNYFFLPRYWKSNELSALSDDIYKKTLFIPIDERISIKDYEQMDKIIRNEVNNVKR